MISTANVYIQGKVINTSKIWIEKNAWFHLFSTNMTNYPVATQRSNVVSLSMQRHDVASTIMRLCSNVVLVLEYDTDSFYSLTLVSNVFRPAEPRFPIHIGISGYVATSGEPLSIPDVYQDSRFDQSVGFFYVYTTLCTNGKLH